MVTLTCFFEQGQDLGQIYVDQDDVEARVLDGTIDPAWLSEEGHNALTRNTMWVFGTDVGAMRGDSCNFASGTCTPRIGPELNNTWSRVETGTNTVQAIKKDGTLWAWGCNVYGQVGDKTIIDRSSPVQEASSTTTWDLMVYGTGGAHVLATKTDGTLWSWGNNGAFKLGNGDATSANQSSPVQEITSSTWISIGMNGSGSFGVKSNGTLWAWGCNGNPTTGSQNLGVNCSDGVCLLCPVQEASSATNWCFVGLTKTGAQSAIKTDGTLWAWGGNCAGEVGDNTSVNRSSPTQETTSSTDWCFSHHANGTAIAIKNEGTLWGWGLNGTRFVVGPGAQTTSFSSPVQEFSQSYGWCKASGCFHMMGLKIDGTLWGWTNFSFSGETGTNGVFSCSPVQEFHSLTTWCDVAARSFATFAIKG